MLGAQELIIILIIVLVLFGGKKMAGLGKALGTSLREFKEEVNKTDEAVADVVKEVKTVPAEITAQTTDAKEKESKEHA